MVGGGEHMTDTDLTSDVRFDFQDSSSHNGCLGEWLTIPTGENSHYVLRTCSVAASCQATAHISFCLQDQGEVF